MKTLKTLLIIVAGLLCATGSFAAHAACDPKLAGATVDCPIFTEPAFTSVPGASMGGSLPSTGGATVVLFNGVVPPNGFMVQINFQFALPTLCYVNDNGTTSANRPGFLFGGANISFATNQPSAAHVFVTPPGYKPMGPVSVYCQAPIEYRGW
jgi:hypothetical protein